MNLNNLEMVSKAIVWFRSDLRLHDNEAILQASKLFDSLIFVYVFDERVFEGKTKFGFRKTDKFRAQFIIDSVADLRRNLKKKGSELIVRYGKPEEILFEICQKTKSSRIFCNRERTFEEVKVQDALESKLWSIGREIQFTRGKMLYYTSDLPFPISQAPDTFIHFKKEVEKIIKIRVPLVSEEIDFKYLPIDMEIGSIPTLQDLGFSTEECNFQKVQEGGETFALNQLKYFLWDSDGISNYKNTKCEMVGRNYSSKLSAYLSQGCISPKKIANEVFKYENSRKKNDSTKGLITELLWRDFFRLLAKKHGSNFFNFNGILNDSKVISSNNLNLFEKWANGLTGIPFIDANMRELNSTGFMSNTGRQVVANFLVNELKLNWLLGAEYFESKLIDYDPCSNYGNWNYAAGLGNNTKYEKSINVLNQAKKYDPNGDYVRKWIPELNKIPGGLIHCPSEISVVELNDYGISDMNLYPNSIIDIGKWN